MADVANLPENGRATGGAPHWRLRRIAALAICLASLWVLYELAMELFIAWYSGSDLALGAGLWAVIVAQVGVDLAAMFLAWRVVRGRSCR